ncbi:MAG: CbtB-domain containing protein [Commensalibacter sp.]|nr:CbtB-domain containing protein [Commensalibacter sp.]
MSQTLATSNKSNIVKPVAIPLKDLVPWAIFGVVISLILIYFVGAEQGATALISGHYVHEFVHDGRHLLGFPCH